MVAENAQYWPEVLTVRDLIDDGAIGEVVTARAATFFPALGDFYGGDQPVALRPGRGGRRRGDRHRLALAAAAARSGSARPTRSSPRSAIRIRGMEGESLCRALLRFESGVVAAFDAMLTTGAHREPAAVHRDRHARASCTVEGSGWVKLWDGTDWKGTKVGEQGGYLQSYEAELADFAAAVLHGTAPAATGRVRARRAPARARDVPVGRDEAVGRRCGHDRRDLRLRAARTCS